MVITYQYVMPFSSLHELSELLLCHTNLFSVLLTSEISACGIYGN